MIGKLVVIYLNSAVILQQHKKKKLKVHVLAESEELENIFEEASFQARLFHYVIHDNRSKLYSLYIYGIYLINKASNLSKWTCIF